MDLPTYQDITSGTFFLPHYRKTPNWKPRTMPPQKPRPHKDVALYLGLQDQLFKLRHYLHYLLKISLATT